MRPGYNPRRETSPVQPARRGVAGAVRGDVRAVGAERAAVGLRLGRAGLAALRVHELPGRPELASWPRPVQPGGFKFASYEYGVRNAQGAWMDRPAVSWSKLGFDLRPLQFSNQSKPDRGAFELFVPFWFLTATFLAPPLSLAVRLIRARRRGRENRCPHCGYDLLATPERCPECGAVPDSTTRI